MTAQYAVFGQPVSHSKSPFIHRAFAAQRSETLTYERIGPAEEDFEEAVRTFFAEGGKGANVTLPFKERAYAMCDVRTERAEVAQAVNTLWMEGDQLHGDNTDGPGMLADMVRHNNWKILNKRVLVLGAGGAVRGVLNCIFDAGVKEVVVTNRTLSRAEELAQHFSERGDITAVPMEDLAAQESFDLIINGTAASLAGADLELPVSLLATGVYCYDMMYAAKPSPFLQWASDHGASTSDGLGMLVEQAAESFYRWHGWRPGTVSVIQALREEVSLV
ncbi:MAG TPA: shikimate dehydrogenase [Alcanivoracaceae bacterium]|nr:shikimate dehydrogenase [Alcanivoracaceae bacterium]